MRTTKSIIILLIIAIYIQGCAFKMASSGYMPNRVPVTEDDITMETVREILGEPTQTSTYFDDTINKNIQIDVHNIKYKKPSDSRSFNWMMCDYFTLFLCEVVGTPYELIKKNELHEHKIYYIDGVVANRAIGYIKLVKGLLDNTSLSKEKVTVAVLPFTGFAPIDKLVTHTDRLIKAFAVAGNITLIDKELIQHNLTYYHFDTPVTDKNKIIQLGKLVKSDYLIIVNCDKNGDYYDAGAKLVNAKTGAIEKEVKSRTW